MKIIIVGCGKVGVSIANNLNEEGHNITLIDTNKDILESASTTYDVMGIVGNGASYQIQNEAGIDQADLLIAVTGSDELNLLCCLLAKKNKNCKKIARVRNPIYSKEIDYIKEELGLSMIINPELAAANEMARVLRFPGAIKVETFAKSRVELLEIQIPQGSVLHNMKVMDISSKLKCNILICGVVREDQIVIPTGSYVLQAMDKITIVAPPKLAVEFFKIIEIIPHPVHSTLIVGGGTLSFYLAKQLIDMGIDVKIIEINRDKCRQLSDVLPEATIINGDGTDQEVLLEEGINYVESFIALTNVDEENLILSLYARSLSKAKLITKVTRLKCDDIVDSLKLGSIISPQNITTEYILQYVRALQNSVGSNVETLYKIINNRAEALAFNIKSQSPVIGVPLEDLNIKSDLLVCCMLRKGKVMVPKGKDSIQLGDTVIVVTTQSGLNDIRDILV